MADPQSFQVFDDIMCWSSVRGFVVWPWICTPLMLSHKLDEVQDLGVGPHRADGPLSAHHLGRMGACMLHCESYSLWCRPHHSVKQGLPGFSTVDLLFFSWLSANIQGRGRRVGMLRGCANILFLLKLLPTNFRTHGGTQQQIRLWCSSVGSPSPSLLLPPSAGTLL